MVSNIVLERFRYGDDGTFGQMYFPDGTMFYTVEQPWRNNEQNRSCIPEGDYELDMRRSPVVQRITRGRYEEGWEVTEVPDRSYIMVHPGNWPWNFQGCIGVGEEYGLISGAYGVRHSQRAFVRFMEVMETSNSWWLVVREKLEVPR